MWCYNKDPRELSPPTSRTFVRRDNCSLIPGIGRKEGGSLLVTWLLSILNPSEETRGNLWNSPPQEFCWDMGSTTQKGLPQTENQQPE